MTSSARAVQSHENIKSNESMEVRREAYKRSRSTTTTIQRSYFRYPLQKMRSLTLNKPNLRSNRISISHGVKSSVSRLRPAPVLPEALQNFVSSASQPHPGLFYGCICNTAVFTLGYKVLRKGLTNEGIAHAWLLGASTWSAFGPAGYSLLCMYFILGTLVSHDGRGLLTSDGTGEGGRRYSLHYGRTNIIIALALHFPVSLQSVG